MTRSISLAMAVLLLFAAVVHAATIRVPDDQPTIQAGVDAAAEGDTVLVACGTYYEHVLYPNVDICLMSETGEADCVTIDAQQEGRVLSAPWGTDTRIVGITFTGGLSGYGGGAGLSSGKHMFIDCAFVDNVAEHMGGGLYFEGEPGTAVTLVGCTFSGNVSNSDGGGGFSCLGEAGEVTLMDCTFSDNVAHADDSWYGGGGGMLLVGGYSDTRVVLTDCTFSGNIADGEEGDGGGLYCTFAYDDTTEHTFSGCAFLGNAADGAGGGMYIRGASGALVNCTFSANLAKQWGGGMAGEGAMALTDCTFEGNRAMGSVDPYSNIGGGASLAGGPHTLAGCSFGGNAAAFGGGAFFSGYDPNDPIVLTGCSFTDNAADHGGAGVFQYDAWVALMDCVFFGNASSDDQGFTYGGGGMCCILGSSTFEECVFAGNASDLGGGVAYWSSEKTQALAGCTFADNTSGIRATDDASITLANTIIAFSSRGEAVASDSASTASLMCCDLFGNDGGDWVGSIADQYGVDGNIWADPLFCDWAQGDLTIAENSPCAPEVNPACGLIGTFGVGCGPATGLPEIAVSDTLLSFDAVCVDSTDLETLLLSNEGTAWLAVDEISVDNDDFSVDPVSFFVGPGSSRAIEVRCTPSAEEPIVGTMTIASNDPDQPTLDVVLEGEGWNAPHISVSETTISFDPVFIGVAVSQVLVVSNVGCGLLTVSDISTNHDDFSVNLTSFVLEPGGSEEVSIEFAPSSEGVITGTLTIVSNDPDDGAIEIALEGEGLVPPEIAVAPDSLDADLQAGETETQSITIENGGGSELVWSIRTTPVEGTKVRLPEARLSARSAVSTSEDNGLHAAGSGSADGRASRLGDLTGVEILWDQAHGQDPSLHTTVVAELTYRGAIVTQNHDPITGSLLTNYDIVWVTDCSDTWMPFEVDALASWVGFGGSLLLEGDSDSSVAAYNDILEAIGAGIEYSPVDGAAGYTTNIYPHPTTEGVESVYLYYNQAHLSIVSSLAVVLVEDSAGVPNSAGSEPGAGRVVAMADDLGNMYHINHGDTAIFVNQAFDWLAGGSVCAWLSCDPPYGTVPVGSFVEVGVTFDATELYGGDYLAEVLVRSNDLTDPEVPIGAHLHVTGAPDIAVSATALDFGVVEVGAALAESLHVWNEGSDLLVVTDVTVDHGDYSVSTTSFALSPEESQTIVVEFMPSGEGQITATLTILSNDPDEGTLLITLTGTGEIVTPVEGSFYAVTTESGTGMLRWTVPSLAGIEGFSVYRGTSPDGPFARVNEELIPPSSPGSFEDRTVWPETTFWYELRAVLADGTEDVIGSLASVTTDGRLAARLCPASPNPFAGETRFSFDVPDHVGPMMLAIYNVRGQLVRTLVEGPVDRGRHAAVWDGCDTRGAVVSSGIYFARLEVDGVVSTAKVLLAR